MQSGRIIWDVTEINSLTFPAMGLDLLEKIDYSVVDPNNILQLMLSAPTRSLSLRGRRRSLRAH